MKKHTNIKSSISFIFIFIACSAFALEVTKDGLVPTYSPKGFGTDGLFLPYNPTVLLVGNKIAHLANSIGKTRKRAAIHCFTSDKEDFSSLEKHQKERRNIHATFGVIKTKKTDRSPSIFYPLKKGESNIYDLSGSVLQPTNKNFPVLYGQSYTLPTYNISSYLKKHNITKMHYIHIDSGGNELMILRALKEALKDCIVVKIKTYKKRIRKGMCLFNDVHQFMYRHDFELLSHYHYDGLTGDALFVKRRYVDATHRRNQL